MTKKVKILLISVLLTVAAVCICLFAGCKVKYTVEELKEKYGLSAQITYFLNSAGGSFNDDTYVKNLYYKAGDKPMDIGGSSALVSGMSALKLNAGFNFTGWYKVETDADKNPLYAADENGEKKVYSENDTYDVTKGMAMSMTDEAFDFSEPLQEGEHIYLCGGFYEDVKLRIYLLCEGEGFEQVDYKYAQNSEPVTIKNGEEITAESTTLRQTGAGVINFENDLKNKFVDGTFVGFYTKDADGNVTPFNGWPIKYPEPDEKGEYHDVILYAKVLKGSWNIVSTSNDVSKMFNYYTSGNYYITQDIDGNGTQIYPMGTFAGTILGEGEGHTLSNFVVEDSSSSGVLQEGNSGSLFGTVTSNAEIKNVTFDNFTVNFTVGSKGSMVVVNVNFIANVIEDGATFTNVSISGSLNITLSANHSHVNAADGNWLYGDKDDATYDKIKVPYATCTIKSANGETVTYQVGTNNNIETEDLK